MPDEHQVYMPASAGPFRCSNCEYYPSAGRCNNEVIMARAKSGQGGLSPSMIVGDLVRVDPGGCSDEFEPRDEFEGDSDDAGKK